MKNKTSILILKGLLFILLFLSTTILAQEVKPDSINSNLYKNAIYGNIGVGGLWFTATAYYERMFRSNAQKSKISTFVKVGYGNVAFWENESSYILGQFGIFTGAKNHHLEASAGFVKSLDADLDLFPLSVTIGYRRQKPDGYFIFRTGVAWPEALYIGIGVNF